MSEIDNELDEFTRIAKAISPKEWREFQEILEKAGQKDKTKLVPVKKQVNRQGKTVTETFWVSPKEAEKMKASGKTEQKAPEKSGKIEVKDKDHLKKLAKEHGLEKVINNAKEQGIKWKEHDSHREVNYMRAAMAINKHMKSGGKFHLDPNSKGKEKSEETKKNDKYKDMVSKLKEKHGKEKLLGMAKKAGVKWDEHSHENLNYMRASMAMKEHLKSGGKIEEEEEKPKGKKDAGETKAKNKQEQPQAPADFTDKFHIRLKQKDKDGKDASGGWKETQGKKVSLGNGVTGYVHMNKDGKFIVSEQRTGTKMSNAYRTTGEAIQEAKDRIGQLGSKVGGVLDSHTAKNGESPTSKAEREKAEEERKKKDGTKLEEKLKKLVEKEVQKKVQEALKEQKEAVKKPAEDKKEEQKKEEQKKPQDYSNFVNDLVLHNDYSQAKIQKILEQNPDCVYTGKAYRALFFNGEDVAKARDKFMKENGIPEARGNGPKVLWGTLEKLIDVDGKYQSFSKTEQGIENVTDHFAGDKGDFRVVIEDNLPQSLDVGKLVEKHRSNLSKQALESYELFKNQDEVLGKLDNKDYDIQDPSALMSSLISLPSPAPKVKGNQPSTKQDWGNL